MKSALCRSLPALRVYVHASSRARLCTHSNKRLPVGVHVCTSMRDHVLVCLSTIVDEHVCMQALIVCMCVRVCESCQGVLNQFCLNWGRHVALLSMRVHRPFIFGLFHKPPDLSESGCRCFLKV